MVLINYTKDAPGSLKQKIKVPNFGDDVAKEIWIEAQKRQKLQDLESWVGCSYADNPIVFLGDLLNKLGLPGFKLESRKKWQGPKGILLHLRVYKAKCNLIAKYPGANIADEKAIREVKDLYEEYRGISLNSLMTRYRDKRNRDSGSIRAVINYLNSEEKTEEEKISFIDNLERACAHVANFE